MASDDTEMVLQEESNNSDEDNSADSPGELSFHGSGDDGGSDDMSPTRILEETNHLRSCLKKDATQGENKKKGISFIETPEIKYYAPEPAEDAIVMETSERVMFFDDLPQLAPEENATPDGDSKAELVRSFPKDPLTDEARSADMINNIDNGTQPMCIDEQLDKKYRCPEEETTWHYTPINVVRKAGQTSLISVDTFSHSASSSFMHFGRVRALTAARSLEAAPAAVQYTVDRDCDSCMGNFISKKFTDSSNGTCRLSSQDRLPDHLPDQLLNETPLEASTMSTEADDIDIDFNSYPADDIAVDFDSSRADDCDAQDSELVSPKDNAAIAKGQKMGESLADMIDGNRQVPQADQLTHTIARTHSLEDGPKYTAGGLGLLKEKKRSSVSSWIRKKFSGLRRLFTSCSRKRPREQMEAEGNGNVDIPPPSAQRLQSYTVSKEVFV